MSVLPSRAGTSPPGLALPDEAALVGTRGRILLAALHRFAEHGYEATSIRDIAGDLGLNSASLYSHFANKEAILAELVRRGHEAHHSRLMEAVLASPGDPLSQLTAFARAHVLVHCQFPRLAVVANIELHALSYEAAAPALALRTQSLAMLVGILTRGQEAGTFALVHLEATAAAIAAIGIQAAHWYPSPVVDLNAEELAEAYAGIVARMVGVCE